MDIDDNWYVWRVFPFLWQWPAPRVLDPLPSLRQAVQHQSFRSRSGHKNRNWHLELDIKRLSDPIGMPKIRFCIIGCKSFQPLASVACRNLTLSQTLTLISILSLSHCLKCDTHSKHLLRSRSNFRLFLLDYTRIYTKATLKVISLIYSHGNDNRFRAKN